MIVEWVVERKRWQAKYIIFLKQKTGEEVLKSLVGSGMWIRERDCYRAALPDPVLLHHAFPGVGRITARMAATRRDRLTGPLPMLAPSHLEGGPGAVRVEVRGRRNGVEHVVVLGLSLLHTRPVRRTAVGRSALIPSFTN